MPSTERFGASAAEWAHFELVLGLGADLLPVVSNPSATISPQSKMKGLGKTPSRYNGRGQVAGIKDWTSHHSTPAEITRWSQDGDLGICVQTRSVRALDCDIMDETQAKEMYAAIEGFLLHPLPTRWRSSAPKFLCAFTLPDGDFSKRVIKTAHGVVEFLATGNQFVAAGSHIDKDGVSRSRYEWAGGLPNVLPTLTAAQFEALWSLLEQRFAIEPSTTSAVGVKGMKLIDAVANDPVAVALSKADLFLSMENDGRIHIICPFESEHTSDGAESSTSYWPANTGGYQLGHFKCLHAHCEHRTDHDFLAALGLAHDSRDDFEAILVEGAPDGTTMVARRFRPVRAAEFQSGLPPGWLVKNVIPHAELGVVFGASGSGKSFAVLDICGAVAQGTPWCGRPTTKGVVVFIVAEGASGFRSRIIAYCEKHGIADPDIYIIAAAPNFMEGGDIRELITEIRALGVVALVVVDTLAQVSAGANENSGEDMGCVLRHCGTLHKVTGAMVLLIHHSGKDQAKGARGWSGIKAGLNVEIEVTRFEHNRTITVTKMRDGEGEGDQFGFTLRTVPVGMDAAGDVISSCVVEHGAVISPKVREKKETEHMKRVMAAVLDPPLSGELLTEVDVIAAAVEACRAAGGNVKNAPRDARNAITTLCDMGRLQRVAPGLIELTTTEAQA